MREDDAARQLLPSPAELPSEYSQYDFDDTIRYREPPYLFEYKGTGFSPLGGIQALSGQKKNGKSILVSVLMATVLNGSREDGRFADRFPGLRLRQSTVGQLGHEPVILYVDTEQERANTSKVVERAKWLCELKAYEHVPRLNIQWLREMPEDVDVAAERWKVIKWKIQQVRPDIVFIDGLRDLVHDFNDLTESARIINELMNLASRGNMCVWCTLHMNPRPSNDDESKMRGHLGTELGNKVSDTFVMKKSKDAALGRFKFTVKQQDARGKDVDEFSIVLNDDADDVIRNLGAPIMAEAISMATAPLVTDSVDDMRGWIKAAKNMYMDSVWPMSKKDFKEKVIRKIGNITNKDRQERDLKACITQGLMREAVKGSNGYAKIEPTNNDNDMPF